MDREKWKWIRSGCQHLEEDQKYPYKLQMIYNRRQSSELEYLNRNIERKIANKNLEESLENT